MDVEERIKKLEADMLELKFVTKVLWRNTSVAEPEWAKEALAAAKSAGLITSNYGGSYDFYRLLTLMHDRGLFDQGS